MIEEEDEEEIKKSEKYIVKSKIHSSGNAKTVIRPDMFVKEPDLGLEQIKMYGMYRVFHEM